MDPKLVHRVRDWFFGMPFRIFQFELRVVLQLSEACVSPQIGNAPGAASYAPMYVKPYESVKQNSFSARHWTLVCFAELLEIFALRLRSC